MLVPTSAYGKTLKEKHDGENEIYFIVIKENPKRIRYLFRKATINIVSSVNDRQNGMIVNIED